MSRRTRPRKVVEGGQSLHYSSGDEGEVWDDQKAALDRKTKRVVPLLEPRGQDRWRGSPTKTHIGRGGPWNTPVPEVARKKKKMGQEAGGVGSHLWQARPRGSIDL